MTKRMLIDAAHPEETRVVLLDGNKLEDFDVEVSSRRQLKGNIYLAKVVRVEPSLQAAFVDYGGNRHGFLAFNEIHPDYYQIPVADREHLLAHEAEYASEYADDEDDDDHTVAPAQAAPAESDAEDAPEAHDDADDEEAGDEEAGDDDTGDAGHPSSEGAVAAEAAEAPHVSEAAENHGEAPRPVSVEVLGGDEADEIGDTRKRRGPPPKQYKIQEVIKRRQVLLVQVVKEERGNKGAALTTYLSLAGRYCVLMPNTARGGGISRKITNAADRKSLKSILSSLDVPDGMAVILRTAGIGRTKPEIKRDFEYLIRLWNTVRDTTLQSTAPTAVHEEGDIVRRSIRDLYSRDIEDVLVEGDDAYKAAKEFMKLLIPSHARKVKQYKDPDTPLLRSYGIEGQLDAIHNPIVHLPAGGYIVINPTEALVSIDVNSGRATKERNIEETALKTNLEAATEIARQLRLRDLAGLIVIDFIDMEVNRNNAQVERRMKDALKHDRARIQVGRISPFGLLEMSRQRLRPSLIETSSEPCPYCGGTGIRRSTESTALVVLRAIDEEGANRRASELTVHVPTPVALYILNHKRSALAELENKHHMAVILTNDDSLIPPDLRLERTKNTDGETISEMVAASRADTQEDQSRKRRKRRRGGRRKDEEDGVEAQSAESYEDEDEIDAADADETEGRSESRGDRSERSEDGEDGRGRRRRRSRRGGRRRRRGREGQEGQEGSEGASFEDGAEATDAFEGDASETDASEDDGAEEGRDEGRDENRPKRRRSRRRRRGGRSAEGADAAASAEGGAEASSEPAESAPSIAAQAQASAHVSEPEPAPAAAAAVGEDTPADKPKKKGWWNIGG